MFGDVRFSTRAPLVANESVDYSIHITNSSFTDSLMRFDDAAIIYGNEGTFYSHSKSFWNSDITEDVKDYFSEGLYVTTIPSFSVITNVIQNSKTPYTDLMHCESTEGAKPCFYNSVEVELVDSSFRSLFEENSYHAINNYMKKMDDGFTKNLELPNGSSRSTFGQGTLLSFKEPYALKYKISYKLRNVSPEYKRIESFEGYIYNLDDIDLGREIGEVLL
jgi:hypothetical protein